MTPGSMWLRSAVITVADETLLALALHVFRDD
jgi:hypothetical protein